MTLVNMLGPALDLANHSRELGLRLERGVRSHTHRDVPVELGVDDAVTRIESELDQLIYDRRFTMGRPVRARNLNRGQECSQQDQRQMSAHVSGSYRSAVVCTACSGRQSRHQWPAASSLRGWRSPRSIWPAAQRRSRSLPDAHARIDARSCNQWPEGRWRGSRVSLFSFLVCDVRSSRFSYSSGVKPGRHGELPPPPTSYDRTVIGALSSELIALSETAAHPQDAKDFPFRDSPTMRNCGRILTRRHQMDR